MLPGKDVETVQNLGHTPSTPYDGYRVMAVTLIRYAIDDLQGQPRKTSSDQRPNTKKLSAEAREFFLSEEAEKWFLLAHLNIDMFRERLDWIQQNPIKDPVRLLRAKNKRRRR